MYSSVGKHVDMKKIGEKGASALAEALKMNTSLQNLTTEIGDYEASVLAEALKMSTSLQTLDLYNNLISEKGARALAEALKMNTSLQNMNLKRMLK
ncbi:hypothetical protein BC936DRAFT_149121 [Jimgerdemannia flammicorona]|uniref:Uncharacterized protein n=1 Tax=Jimgerdemannia flammicorona TaxID=994334 RepID=A0A433D1J6_9FUNG|nr:hypothetical protein BC936DRAFT_149121 [Jimgerdemannia flammicorona]